MAVPEQTPYIEYTANGSTTTFALGFTCSLKDELHVLINNVEQSASTWSLANNSVSFNAAPSNGSKVTLYRETKLKRVTDYSSVNNSFRPSALNAELDRVWYSLQDMSFKVGRYDYDYDFILNQTRPVLTGGTGATTAAGARTNLNVYSKTEANNLFIENTEKGTPNGIATLDANVKVDPIYLPTLPNTAIPKATETALGVVELATQTEVNTGTDDERAITSKKLLAGVKNHLNATGNAPMYACRAWVNFNGVNNTIVGSGNVSSITDNGTGDYTINFTTAMQDANYAISGNATQNSGSLSTSANILILKNATNGVLANKSTTSFTIVTVDNSSDAYFDSNNVSVAVFR